jgi:glycine oxidase
VKRNHADVAIVGAGVIGCAIARELAARNLRVMLIERDAPGRHASWAAAGMLSPFGESTVNAPFVDLADESLRRYASFAAALHDETGIDVQYGTEGRLHVSLGDPAENLSALAGVPDATSFEITHMDGDAARRLEPALSVRVTDALRIGRDHRVNNRLLAQALTASAVAAGVDLRKARTVMSIIARNGAIVGLRLHTGELIEADRVVLAAGAWTGDVAGLPRDLPVRPVKGQMFAVDGNQRQTARSDGGLSSPITIASAQPSTVASQQSTIASAKPMTIAPAQRSPILRHVVFSRKCYIVPRDDGRLLVGATVEDVGFDYGPTQLGIGGLMSAAADIIPLIESLPIVETWAGFRPATPDDLPILGADPDLRGLLYATGHYRNGILLAPVTAACIAATIMGEQPPVAYDAFSISRFPRTVDGDRRPG